MRWVVPWRECLEIMFVEWRDHVEEKHFFIAEMVDDLEREHLSDYPKELKVEAYEHMARGK